MIAIDGEGRNHFICTLVLCLHIFFKHFFRYILRAEKHFPVLACKYRNGFANYGNPDKMLVWDRIPWSKHSSTHLKSTCFTFFRSLRLVDVKEFQQKTESMELATFQNLVMRHIDSAKEKLLKK